MPVLGTRLEEGREEGATPARHEKQSKERAGVLVAGFSLVERVERLSFVCFHSGNRLVEHRPGFFRRTAFTREHDGRA
jgi:hypothetical protein